MALPNVRPINEWPVGTHVPSMGTTPTAVSIVCPVKGKIVRTFASTNGATTGTIAVAVTCTGSATDIGTGGLSIPAGTGPIPVEDFPANSGGNAIVNEGDFITFTPSGGSGSSITGYVGAVIREVG